MWIRDAEMLMAPGWYFREKSQVLSFHGVERAGMAGPVCSPPALSLDLLHQHHGLMRFGDVGVRDLSGVSNLIVVLCVTLGQSIALSELGPTNEVTKFWEELKKNLYAPPHPPPSSCH